MATITDVARLAGVSASTVSYVLSGKRPISAPTRQRVVAAMDALGFEPNAPGRALASKRTRTLGLLFPNFTSGVSEFQLEFVTSALAAASAADYGFLLSTAPADQSELLAWTRRGLVDGVILMQIRLHDQRVALLRERGFPFAMIGHCEKNDGLDFVDLDFEDAVATAYRHLAELGHRRIAFVNGPISLHTVGYGPSVRSLRGFQAVADEMATALFCESSLEAGYHLACDLLRSGDWTAIITLNREAIPGILQAVADLGRRVPDDLSLVALVSDRVAELFTPALTAVGFPAAAMGRIGAEMLIHRLEGGDVAPVQRMLRAELTVRRSSAPRAGLSH